MTNLKSYLSFDQRNLKNMQNKVFYLSTIVPIFFKLLKAVNCQILKITLTRYQITNFSKYLKFLNFFYKFPFSKILAMMTNYTVTYTNLSNQQREVQNVGAGLMFPKRDFRYYIVVSRNIVVNLPYQGDARQFTLHDL